MDRFQDMELKRRFRCAMVVALSMLLFQQTSWTAETDDVRRLVEQLSSSNFEERHLAQRALIEIAEASPEDLAFLASDAAPEVAGRLIQLLERTFLNHTGEIADRAEQSLMVLAQRTGPAAVAAQTVLVSHARLREGRARAAISALKGEVGYSHFGSREGNLPALAQDIGLNLGPPQVLTTVWLHEDWRGTADDLWHLARLSHCIGLTIYTIQGNNVELVDLYRLSQFIPGLSVAQRGPCLGIKNSAFLGTECIVGDLLKGGSAEKAGILRGDRITALDGAEIRSFPHLVESLQVYSLNDKITLTVIRENPQHKLEAMDIEVTLGSWRGVQQHSDEAANPPAIFTGPCGPPLTVPPPVPLPQPLHVDNFL